MTIAIARVRGKDGSLGADAEMKGREQSQGMWNYFSTRKNEEMDPLKLLEGF